LGRISAVIHAAGISPNVGTAKTIMEVNALGTISINEAFYNVMEKGSCLLDVSSMSGHMVPGAIMPTRKYRYSRKNKSLFMKMMLGRVYVFPKKLHSSLAYGISKNFVTWYAKSDTLKFGQKGIRVLSVSPGSFETPMGELEGDRVSE
jgi:NAD(P)-dependent dehydrogenase (short-subunit alcohol dehydrogenase family)